jgi:hypothetical protein
MAKIGRNEQCPCRSGKKYKYCCALNQPRSVPQPPSRPAAAGQVTLMGAVNAIQADAVERKTGYRELGVFFFYSTAGGDAWLLEMTECDCVQVARAGQVLEPPINEDSEVIEINYSHTFSTLNKQLRITAYSDNSSEILVDAPTRELHAAMRRIRKKFTGDQLKKVHLPPPGEAPSV